MQETLKFLNGEDNSDFDYIPMMDADEKTLKLKIQMRDVTKPPMWREVLVPADFNFSQLHYVIQAAVGLDNCHLWQFEKKPYGDGFKIGIPKDYDDFSSYGLEDCTFHADDTPLTAFLAQKGDKLAYVYDFRLDWIFDISVLEVMDRDGEVAECRKYKSELQALDDYPAHRYTEYRDFIDHWGSMSAKEKKARLKSLEVYGTERLEATLEDHLIDLEFVNEELADIPDTWVPID